MTPKPARDYDIALIVVDDLRADHVSSYGYGRATTPHLDRRSASGTIFENCMTPTGWTLSACASIITGHTADAHGLTDHDHRFQRPKLGDYLGDRYRRVAFTNNGNTIPDTISEEALQRLGLKRRPAKWKFFGWDEGFDVFHWTPREDHLGHFERARKFLVEQRQAANRPPQFLFFHTNLVHDYHMDREYFLEVEDWLGRTVDPSLREFRDGPWVWTSPPEDISPGRLVEDIVAKYDSGVRACDRLVDGLLSEIDFERTIVIFVSDHGEGFEPGLGRVHHCGRLHQDLLHVPLVMWLPEDLRKQYELAAVDSRHCSTLDIVPTVLALTGQVVDRFPGRMLFDLSTHRRLEGIDRGYVFWGEDCHRESYDTCQIEITSELIYPLKSIRVRRNDQVREFAYNLAYDPGETDNLLDRRGRTGTELEPVSFVVAVNDWAELETNLLASPVARSPRHQWVLVDNRDNRFYNSISRLYYEAAEEASHDLVFFMHQDLFLPAGWEERVALGLKELEEIDPDWGVLGGVGAIKALENTGAPKVLKGHWCDPHGYQRCGALPAEVESLDEQWLGVRRSRGVSFDPDLPGFHCYGIDISLIAREAGLKSYAIDAFVWHKFRDALGRLITGQKDSPKIRERWSGDFMEQFNPAAEFVEKKWSKYLPFQTTSWNWK